jgi:predicted HicB family RNase H-like nuclease
MYNKSGVIYLDIKKRKRTAAQDKYDKENIETVSFKTKKGARERIKEAATATGQSTNGFIRSSLNKAVQEATGQPMETPPVTNP